LIFNSPTSGNTPADSCKRCPKTPENGRQEVPIRKTIFPINMQSLST
jgi:hypothetical protein